MLQRRPTWSGTWNNFLTAETEYPDAPGKGTLFMLKLLLSVIRVDQRQKGGTVMSKTILLYSEIQMGTTLC